MSNKLIGYILSGIGLLLIIISSAKGQEIIPLPFSAKIVLGAGALFVVAGVFLLSGFTSKRKQPKEVPIYQGKGKKRVVVGYQREGK